LPSARQLHPDVEEGASPASHPSAKLSGQGVATAAAATASE